jgi:AcrR family transcriptional regulator
MAPVGRRDSLGRGARDRILAAAAELFVRQGFNATAVNELHRAARVSKRTLYQHFGSKDDLIVAYVLLYGRTGPVEALLNREDLAPRTRLLELFTALAGPQSIVPDPILAAAVEFPNRMHPVHLAAASVRCGSPSGSPPWRGWPAPGKPSEPRGDSRRSMTEPAAGCWSTTRPRW